MKKLFFFGGGILKLIAEEAVKRNGAPQNQMQCLFAEEFQRLKKSKGSNLKGSHF